MHSLSRIFPAAFVMLLMVLQTAFAAESKSGAQIVFMIGESEYDTANTLQAFAKTELDPRGLRCTFALVSKDSEHFQGIDALKTADLLFISVRRHAPPKEEMDIVRAYIAANKPVIGIRTASHAFGKRVGEKEGVWETFDQEVLGGNYSGHYGVGVSSLIRIVPEMLRHPLLQGLEVEEFSSSSHLYKNRSISPWVFPLLTGRVSDRPEVEPVAWYSEVPRRMFYTSLGSPTDFALPQFKRLLLNAIIWSLKLDQSAMAAPRVEARN